MTIEELLYMLKILLIERQNNNHTGNIKFDIEINQGGIRACKKIEEVMIKDKRKIQGVKVKKTIKKK